MGGTEVDTSVADADGWRRFSHVSDGLAIYFVPTVADGVIMCEVFGFSDGDRAGS